MKNFEIAWREELMKRLQAPMNTLNRQYDREQAQRLRRVEELREYASPEEAHEAYGYGDITLEEYDQICHDFSDVETTPSPVSAARDELADTIRHLEEDIRYFTWEALSDEEKEAIEKRNKEWHSRHHAPSMIPIFNPRDGAAGYQRLLDGETLGGNRKPLDCYSDTKNGVGKADCVNGDV